jgi:hypothetical protein
MRRLLAVAFLALPTPAWALGIGTTGYFGPDFAVGYTFFGTNWQLGGTWLPSLDLYPTENISIQIHALDTLAWLLDDSDLLFLGGDMNFTVLRTGSFPAFDGVVQPGFSLDLYDIDGDTGMVLGGHARIGMEGGSDMMFGVYLVPGLGIVAGDFDEDVAWSGTLQVSMWFGGGADGQLSNSASSSP